MNMLDSSFNPLLPYLQSTDISTLWIADENALHTLEHLPANASPLLSLITNRYDIYTLAKNKGMNAAFNDFDFSTLDTVINAPIERVVYRISKEKALTHHIFIQSAKLLSKNKSSNRQDHNLQDGHVQDSRLGELIISGKKQEGIKSYQQYLTDTLQSDGRLKKQGVNYSGIFSNFSNPSHPASKIELDESYQTIMPLPTPLHSHISAQSKPGVFGWDKIDSGTELLLSNLSAIIEQHSSSPKNLLDMGCGYGWIFMNLPYYLDKKIIDQLSVTATDNNATALLCAEINSKNLPFNTSLIADDCAKNINEKFDLILCNPPFHQGFSHDKSLTSKFLEQIKIHLKVTGMAVLVINEFISLPKQQLALFQQYTVHTKQQGFKIIILK
jgi:16S rRNA (guanine1207-N2)-methyltransferase